MRWESNPWPSFKPPMLITKGIHPVALLRLAGDLHQLPEVRKAPVIRRRGLHVNDIE